MLFGSAAKHAKQHYNGSDDLDRVYFHDILSFASLDGYNVVNDGTSAINPYGNSVNILTGNLTDNDSVIRPKYPYVHMEYGSSIDFSLVLASSVADIEIYMIMCKTQLSAPPAVTNEYWGFKMINADISAICCAGAAETTTDTTYDRGGGQDRQTFKAFLLYPRCKYYVNGVLVATHTTNVPFSSNVGYPHIICRTKADAAKSYTFERIAFSSKLY